MLDCAMFVKLRERAASMIAPANASPKERPNDPAAELTPAASLTRSSVIGDKVTCLIFKGATLVARPLACFTPVLPPQVRFEDLLRHRRYHGKAQYHPPLTQVWKVGVEDRLQERHADH